MAQHELNSDVYRHEERDKLFNLIRRNKNETITSKEIHAYFNDSEVVDALLLALELLSM